VLSLAGARAVPRSSSPASVLVLVDARPESDVEGGAMSPEG
jgi:hypothetical protein